MSKAIKSTTGEIIGKRLEGTLRALDERGDVTAILEVAFEATASVEAPAGSERRFDPQEAAERLRGSEDYRELLERINFMLSSALERAARYADAIRKGETI